MRNYKRKTDRASVPPDTMHRAALLVLNKEMSNRLWANEQNICHVTLMRYYHKLRSLEGRGEMPSIGYSKPRKELGSKLIQNL